MGIDRCSSRNLSDWTSIPAITGCRRWEYWSAAGGDWIFDAIKTKLKANMALAGRTASPPAAIHGDAKLAFNMTHAGIQPIGSTQDKFVHCKDDLRRPG
jgi:hypothetical protein